jgi:hypothetical protein
MFLLDLILFAKILRSEETCSIDKEDCGKREKYQKYSDWHKGVIPKVWKDGDFQEKIEIRDDYKRPGISIASTISLTPGITEKRVPPRHQSRYIGSTLDVVYRKLNVVEAPITFAIGS